MPETKEAAELFKRYIQARVPVVIVRSIERSRALNMVQAEARKMQTMPFVFHSRTTGLQELDGRASVIEDKSLIGALDYATQMFGSRQNANIVFSDVEDIENETPASRHFAESVRLAESRGGTVVLIVAGPVWSDLARLGMTITLELPNQGEIMNEIKKLIDDNRERLTIEWGDEEIRRSAEVLHGVTMTEVINVVATLLVKGSLKLDDVNALSQFKDQIFGDLSGLEKIPMKEDFSVGGLTNLRDWLEKKESLMKADLSKTALHPPKGVLLCGVPGCGKSLSAKAIASSWGLPLYRLDMASILGMYVGQSEQRLREALDAAERVAPCVLWIDEIEKGLAGGSGSGSADGGTTRRLVGQFLFWLQESKAKVFMVATANDVSSLPPELLRKGRFDEIFFVDLPDPSDRHEIIDLYFKKYLNAQIDGHLLEKLVEVSDGFAGSDIESVVHDVATEMFRLNRSVAPSEAELINIFRDVLPFSKTNPDEVAQIRQWGRDRAIPASKVSTNPSSAGQDNEWRRLITVAQ